jgi:hypothetical protein
MLFTRKSPRFRNSTNNESQARQRNTIPQVAKERSGSLQIGANDLNDIVGSFAGGLGVARHVVADVVFHQLRHQAIDGAVGGRKTLQNVVARILLIQGAKNAFQLPDYLFWCD